MIPQKEPFIIKKLMNEIIPKSLQKDNLMANAAFSSMMLADRSIPQYDFQEGVYESMPRDPRGVQLLMIRQAAEKKAQEIERQFKNLTTVVNDEDKPMLRTNASQKVLQRVMRVITNESEQGDDMIARGMNNELAMTDLRSLEPSATST